MLICLICLCVAPVRDWQPIQDVACLSPGGSPTVTPIWIKQEMKKRFNEFLPPEKKKSTSIDTGSPGSVFPICVCRFHGKTHRLWNHGLKKKKTPGKLDVSKEASRLLMQTPVSLSLRPVCSNTTKKLTQLLRLTWKVNEQLCSLFQSVGCLQEGLRKCREVNEDH